MIARAAVEGDIPAITRIYNAGVAERIATFETRPRAEAEIAAWLSGEHPVVVVEDDGDVVGFAAAFSYSPRDCYRGVREFSVYVAPGHRQQGVGALVLSALIDALREAGAWKLVSRVFVENRASRRLLSALGFREVGIHEKHAVLDGVWRDVVVVERLIPENLQKL